MWKIKFLKGPLRGQGINLKEGENTVGRADDCEVVIPSGSVSKRHAKFFVQNNKITLIDLGSSNGTFVNGTRIKEKILKSGDKVGFHDVIAEVTYKNLSIPMPHESPMWGSNLAYQQQPTTHPEQNIQPAQTNFLDYAKDYFEKVIMPGLYHLNTVYSTKQLLAIFVSAFMIMVTILTTIPMAQLSKENVQKEAQRRALTIARQLASVSERAFAQGAESGIRTDFAENEDGVKLALIVSREDGHIIAPLAKAQSYANEEFVARARKKDEIFVEQTSLTTVGASVPIKVFSQELGNQVTTAFAVVLYKMESLDWGSTVALFARILIIAGILGVLLFAVLYRIITEPIKETIRQVDQALRGEKNLIAIKSDFEELQKLTDNINTLLSRIGMPSHNQPLSLDRTQEAGNLVRIVNDPAFALDKNFCFIHINTPFEELTGMRLLTLQGQTLHTLQDQALKLNIEDLIQRAKNQIGFVQSSELEINGIQYEIDVQAMAENSTDVSFYFGTIKKKGGFV